MLQDNSSQTNGQTLALMLALLLPPVAVYREAGITKAFWINVLLTLLGYFPGGIHAVFVVLKRLRSEPRVEIPCACKTAPNRIETVKTDPAS
jgi:uncharacterized membrane protein YqaE (UPF0057 family)